MPAIILSFNKSFIDYTPRKWCGPDYSRDTGRDLNSEQSEDHSKDCCLFHKTINCVEISLIFCSLIFN